MNTYETPGYNLKHPALYDFYEGEAPLDWEAIKATSPLRLVFEATVGRHGRYGNDKPDGEVGNFVSGAKKYGIGYGLYHLLLPDNISEQAQFYCDTVHSLGGLGNMMPIVDVEVDNFAGYNIGRGLKWASQIKDWLDIIEGQFGQKPLIYTSKYYWSFTHDRDGQPPEWTKEYFGWFAGYLWMPYLDSDNAMPRAYQANGFTTWAVWQYYDKGKDNPPRGYGEYNRFANDLNVVNGWFVDELGRHEHAGLTLPDTSPDTSKAGEHVPAHNW